MNFNKIKKQKTKLKTIKYTNTDLIHFEQEHTRTQSQSLNINTRTWSTNPEQNTKNTNINARSQTQRTQLKKKHKLLRPIKQDHHLKLTINTITTPSIIHNPKSTKEPHHKPTKSTHNPETQIGEGWDQWRVGGMWGWRRWDRQLVR